MMKRIIALLLALILTVGLLPTVALAAEGGETPTTGTGDVKNGYYEGTTWKEGPLNQGKLPTGVESVSKTAKPTSNPNEYEVTLEVVLKKTESQENPGSAATVLVLDHSGSMNGCAYCKSTTDDGVNYYHTEGCKYDKPHQWVMVTSEQSRMSAATKAVKDFIKTYSGRFDENGQETTIADLNLGRWVCLVWFNKKGGVTGGGDWVDVSNKSGYQTATNTNGWKAHDGTNLDCGLRLADHWLKQSPVASINKSLKNVIVLSDGEPTFYLSKGVSIKGSIKIGNTTYYVHGSGKDCKKDTYNTTKITAATLRNSASVYTVCFGASGNEIKDYDKNGNQKITVGNYLKQKIATQPKSGANEKFAYNAADADALNTAFAAISKTIVSGLSTGTVKDSLPDGITATGMSGEMTWKLDKDFTAATPETTTENGQKETTYKYTKTYTVTIDPDDEKLVTTEDGYAPLNGKTTLTVKNSQGTDVEIPFPIPAGKVTPTKITDEITVTITGATNAETYDGTEKKAEGYTVMISDPRYTTKDFTFLGTNVVKATNASTNQYMMGLKADDFTNNNEKFTNVKFVVNDGWLLINKRPLTIEANDNTVDYDGKPHGEDGYVATGLAKGDTVESVTFNGSQTNPGTYENLLVPSEAVIKNAKGDDVKNNYIITYTPGTLVINKLTNAITVTITGKQETKDYNGQTQTVTGFDYTVEGAGHDDVTVTLKENQKAEASGKDVKTVNDGKYSMNLTSDMFDVSSTKYSNVTITTVNDGWLKITPIAITLKSVDASKTYDGAALTKKEVTVTSGNFVSGEGLDYVVTGSQTEVGTSKNTYTYTAKTGTTLTNYTITKEVGDLTVTLPDLTALPNVTVDCINPDVSHSDKTGITLTAANQYELGDPQKVTNESAYTRTITLTGAGKEYCIGEYNKDIAGHTEAAGGTTTITLKYSKEGSDWTWRATPANFLVNVQCNTPTVNVNLGNYIKKTLTGTNFRENFEATFTVNVSYGNEENAEGSVTLTDAAQNTPFAFNSNITLKRGFYYTFSVTEQEANVPGVTCDTTTHEFALNVKTDGTVEFGSVVDKQFVPAGAEADQFLTITNTYAKPTYAVKKSVVEDPSITVPTGVDKMGYQYPTGGKFIVEKTYTDDTITFLYVIEVSGKNGAEMTIQEKDGGKFISVDYSTETRATINPNAAQDTYTVKLTADVDASNPIKLYAEKTFHKDADGKFPTTATNALLVNGEEGPKDDTTIIERGSTVIDFSKMVQKHLTATGNGTVSEVTFYVDVVGGRRDDAIAYALPEVTISDTYRLVLMATFNSVTGNGYDETKPFEGAIPVNQAGVYIFKLTERTDAAQTSITYDETEYLLYVNVEPKSDGSLEVTDWHIVGSDNTEFNAPGKITFHNTIDTGKDDYYPIIIPTIIGKDTGMLNKTDHFAYVIGYPDGTVHPNGQITRAEVATIFFRLLRDEVRDGAFTTSNSYSDVAYGKWYNNPISTMSALGIITGYPDGTFKPNKPITRAEFAAIAARFDETQSGKSATFSDVIGHWAAKEIGIAYANEWIKGYPDGTFKPDQNITRAEAMTMINRVLERKPESPADLLTNMNKWTDNMDTSKWYYLDVQEATNSHGYTRKTFNYELWRQMLPDPDWSRYER